MTPDCAVAVAGADITDRLRQTLAEVRVVSTTDRTTDTAEIRFAASDAAIAAPPTGRELRVALGYRETGLVDLGAYWHSETDLECAPGPVVVVRATGADLRPDSAIKTPRTRAWHDTTLGALVEAVAADHGLSPRIDPALAAEPVPHEDQTAESDLHLVRRLAVQYGAAAKVVGPDLVFGAAGSGRSASGAEMPSVELTPTSGVVSLRVAYRDRPKVAAVRAPYWVYVEAAPRHAVAGDGAPAHDLPDPYPDQPRAQAAANAALARHHRAAATLEAALPGTPTLSAGAAVITSGWPIPTANGRWIASRVTHTLTPAAYTTDIQATAPSP